MIGRLFGQNHLFLTLWSPQPSARICPATGCRRTGAGGNTLSMNNYSNSCNTRGFTFRAALRVPLAVISRLRWDHFHLEADLKGTRAHEEQMEDVTGADWDTAWTSATWLIQEYRSTMRTEPSFFGAKWRCAAASLPRLDPDENWKCVNFNFHSFVRAAGLAAGTGWWILPGTSSAKWRRKRTWKGGLARGWGGRGVSSAASDPSGWGMRTAVNLFLAGVWKKCKAKWDW